MFQDRKDAIIEICERVGFTELAQDITLIDGDKKLMDTMRDVCKRLLCAKFNNSTDDGHCGVCGRSFENHCDRLSIGDEICCVL